MKTIEERKAILEKDISRHVSHGWRILSRTETSCKLEKDWKPNSSILNFFVLGILYPIAGVAKIWFNFSIQGIYSDLQGMGH